MEIRRRVLKSATGAGAFAMARAAITQIRSDTGPKDSTASPYRGASRTQRRSDLAGRGSMLPGRVAVMTGAARGIDRAIAVEMAANGADVVVVNIA